MKTFKRALSLLLAVVMVLSVMPMGMFTPASAAVTLLTTSTSAQYHLKRMMTAHGNYGNNADGYRIQVTGTVNLAQSFSASTIKGWTGTLSNAPAWNNTVAQELMDNYMRQESDGKYSFAYIFPSKIDKVNVNGGFTATYYFWSDTPITHPVSGGGTIVFKLRDSGALANAVDYMASGNLTNKSVKNSQQFQMQVDDGDFSTDVTLPAYVKLTVPSGKTMRANDLTLTSHATSPGNIDGAGTILVAGTVTNPENISGPTLWKYAEDEGALADGLGDASFVGVVLGSDIETEENIVIPAGKTIDFNGCTLTCNTYQCVGTELHKEEGSVVQNSSATETEAGDAETLFYAFEDADIVTLTADIDFSGDFDEDGEPDILGIPDGKTLDLDGHNLYVDGFVNEGLLLKNGGKLWANASSNAKLTETPTMENVTNFWAANEALLAENSPFDGIRLTNNIGYNQACTAADKTTILPNMYAAGALSTNSTLCHAVAKIPEGKTLDLNGFVFSPGAVRGNMGAGDIVDNSVGGTGYVRPYFYQADSSVPCLKYAIQLANNHPDVVKRIYQSSGTVDYTGYVIPATVTLGLSDGSTASHVTFAVASESGFTRPGTEYAAAFKLTNPITLTDDVDLDGKDIDYDWNPVFGGELLNPGTETNKPLAEQSVADKSELDAALVGHTVTITLTDTIDYDDVLTIPAGVTIDLDGNDLYVTGLTGSGTITKNGGKVWANVSANTKLTAAPTLADVSNVWAANEMLLATDTPLDGIRLTADLTDYDSDHYATNNNTTDRDATLPNMVAQGAFTSSLYYATLRIPAGKTLDLNGHTLRMVAANSTMGTTSLGTGTIEANGGSISLRVHNQSTYKFAVGIANAHKGLFSDICYQNANTSNSINTLGTNVPDYPVPAGVALITTGAYFTNVVFEVADEADFTREGTANEAFDIRGFKLVDDIALTDDVDIGSKDIDYNWHTVTGGEIITEGTESNKRPETNEVEVNTSAAFGEALSTATKITLTANLNYNAVLTVPAYMEIDLNGKKLYVTGLTNNGTITKNGGLLLANVGANAAITAAVSTTDVTNFWAAEEELLDPNTDFDGIRLTANLSSANPAGTVANVQNYLPRLHATGAYVASSSNEYYVPQIPAGKTLDLNGKAANFYASANNIGDGTVIDSAGTAGRIRLMFNDSTSRGTYANALAIAATRPTQKIFRFQQAGTMDYTGLAAIPANAFLVCTTTGGTATNVTFLVDDQAGLTREGTTYASKFVLANDLELTADVDVGAADVDYDNHQVTGGKIITTGTEYNKPAVVVNPEVGTKVALQAAIEAELEEITLTADIDYNAALTIPAGTTLDLDGNDLYVTGLTVNGTLTKNGGKVWANVSTAAQLTAEPTAADVSNIYAAQEVLWQSGAQFDGVRLTADVSEQGKKMVADAASRSFAPSFAAAGGFSTNTGIAYATFLIPAGKTLDLNGKTFTMYAGSNYNDADGESSNSATFGEGTIEANGGSITLLYYSTSGSAPSLRGAWQLAKETDAIGQFKQTSSEVDYTSYYIPAGVTLAKTGGTFKADTVITFMVADAADLTRTGTELADVAKAFRLSNDITLTADVDVGDAAVNYNWHAVTGGSIITTGAETNKIPDTNEVEADTLEAFTEALTTATKITLTADIDFGAALTIPAWQEIDLNGHKLFVTGITANGTVTKNGGTLWANVSSNGAITAAVSAANVSNLWAANEELLTPGTLFDGILITTNLASASNAGSPANTAAFLPLLTATGAGFTGSNGAVYFVPQIPAGKTLDLGNKYILCCATATTLGAGTITGTTNAGIRLYIYPSTGAGTYENALAIVNSRPTQQIVRVIQAADHDYAEQAALPVNAQFSAANESVASNLTMLADDEAGLTRTGLAAASKVCVIGNITLTANADMLNTAIEVAEGYTLSTGEYYLFNTTVTANEAGYGTFTGNVLSGGAAGTKAALDAALEGSAEVILLTADIDYADALTIPAGKTIDLGGKNLYVTGLTNNGTITKNGGKLWASVSAAATLTEAPTTADVSNIWAAAEEMNRAGTEFDGIVLTTDVDATGYPYDGSDLDAAHAWQAANLPGLTAADAFSSNTKYGIVKIPSGKTLDLGGHNLKMRAVKTTLGEGTFTANGGSVTACFNATNGNAATLASAVALAKAHPGFVTTVHQTSAGANFTNYPIPSGVGLTKAGAIETPVTFEVANAADFTRTGYDLANVFKLVNALELTADKNVGATAVDFNGFFVTGGKVTTTGTVTKNGGGNVITATTVGELTAAVANTTGKIIIAGNVTLTAALDADNIPIEVAEGFTFSTGGFALTNTTVTANTEGYGTFEGTVVIPLTSLTNLQAALNQAGSGDTVTLTQSLDGDTALTIPTGVTLALGAYDLAAAGITNNGAITKTTGKLTWKVSFPSTWVQSYTNEELLQDNSFLKALDAMNGTDSPIDTIKFATNIWASVSAMSAAIEGNIFPNLQNDGSRYKISIPAGKTVDMNGKNLYVKPNTASFGEGTLYSSVSGSVVRTYCASNTELTNTLTLAASDTTLTFEMMTNSSWTGAAYDVKGAQNVNFKMNTGNSCTFKSVTVADGRVLDLSGGNGATLAANYLKMGRGATFNVKKDKVTLPEVILFAVSPSTLAEDVAHAEAQIAYLQTNGILNIDNITFKLTLDGDYNDNIDLSAYDHDFEFAGSYVTGTAANFHSVTVAEGKSISKDFGGGYATTVGNKNDFATAAGNSGNNANWDKIIVNGTFSLTQSVNAGAKVVEILAGKTLTVNSGYTLSCGGIIGDGTFVGALGQTLTVGNATELTSYLKDAKNNSSNTYVLTLTTNVDATGTDITTIPSNVQLDLAGFDLYVRHLNGTGTVANGSVTYNVANAKQLDRALDAIANSNYKSLMGTIVITQSFDYGKTLAIPENVTVRFNNNYRVITTGVMALGTVDKGDYPYAAFALGVKSAADIDAANSNLKGCDEMVLTASVTYNGTLTLAQKLDLNGKTLTVGDIAVGSGAKLLNYRYDKTTAAPGTVRLAVATAEALANAASNIVSAADETVACVYVSSSNNALTVTETTVGELVDSEKIAIVADITLDRDITLDCSVKLEADSEGNGYVLDLNGHTLNLGSHAFATSFGFVKDSATDDAETAYSALGLLKAGSYSMANTSRNSSTDSVNAYQPIYDYVHDGKHVNGYRFFKLATNLRTKPKEEDGKLVIKFIFDFVNKEAWDILANSQSGVQLFVNLEATVSEAATPKSLLFVFNDATMQSYAAKQKAETSGKQNVLIMSFSSYESLRGKTVWTDPYLGMRGDTIAYENHAAAATSKLKLSLDGSATNDKTIGEMIDEGDLSPAQDALVATAFAYYNMNPLTQYGMNYYGHTSKIYTDAEGNVIGTEPGIGNMLTNVFFNTRMTRGWRRTTRISPESVAEDSMYYSQCSEFPYNVYYNTILNEDGTPFEYYGGPSALFDSWYKDGVRGLVPVDANGTVLDRSDYNFAAKLSYYRMPNALEISADTDRSEEYGYVVTGYNDGTWSGYKTVMPANKVGNPTVESAIADVAEKAQAGDIFYVPSHVLICIGDYDGDGYVEFMHSWPVVSTDDDGDFTSNGNFAPETIYYYKAVTGTGYFDIYEATHYLDTTTNKMVAFEPGTSNSVKKAKGNLYTLKKTYEAGEAHEQSGALEIVELKNNKLTVDTPISSSVSTSTQRFNLTAENYFFVFRPLMGTKQASELATGLNQSLSCVGATVSPAAAARRDYGTAMGTGVKVEKYVYDGNGNKVYTWDALVSGGTYTLKVTVNNNTANAITFTEVREGLPEGTTFVSASAGGAAVGGTSRNVTWNNVAVAANGTTTVSITFTVNALPAGTVLDFPNGYVGQLESRHFGLKVAANAADAADATALSALANDGSLEATIQGSDEALATDLAFVKQVYKNVVGKELDIPDTAADYIAAGFVDSTGAKGYDFESAYFKTKMYKSVLVDTATKETEIARGSQAGNMAEMVVNKHIGGKLTSLCIDANGNFSPFAVVDDNMQENLTMYELLYENRYQVGDFLMTVQACHSVDRDARFYGGNGKSAASAYTMNTDTQYVTVSIYLGNGKVLEVSGNGAPEVKIFTASEFNTAVGEAFFGVFRPRQSDAYGN